MSIAAARRTRRYAPLRDDDIIERSVVWGTAGYFLLDLVALVTPPRSPLDVGQSVALVMTMLFYRMYMPINTSRKYEVSQLVAVIILGSTVLDVIDVIFNVDPDEPISVYPPVVDLIISLIFLAYLCWELCRVREIIFSRIVPDNGDMEAGVPMVPAVPMAAAAPAPRSEASTPADGAGSKREREAEMAPRSEREEA